jgi:hypothetical protein
MVFLLRWTGKSLVVDYLESKQTSQSDRASVFIYCDYDQRNSQTPLALLSSLLEQVLRRSSGDGLPSEVSSLYALHKKYNTRPTLPQITDLFRGVCSHYTVVHIVVDALDECAETEEYALEFIKAVQALGANVKLMCTSRFSTTFDPFFGKATRLQISARSEDIRTFLKAHIQQHSRLSAHVRADINLEEEVITAINEEAQGMYAFGAFSFLTD